VSHSRWEAILAVQIRAAGLPEPEREVVFAPPRRFRFDFAWRCEHGCRSFVAVEVEGATWVAGRHTRGVGFENDCKKLNLAAIEGWCVLRFTPAMIRSGEAVKTLEKALTREVRW
jgi:hypothetical protein